MAMLLASTLTTTAFKGGALAATRLLHSAAVLRVSEPGCNIPAACAGQARQPGQPYLSPPGLPEALSGLLRGQTYRDG